ncbi:MAG: PAS domain-containing protein [Proteobacteria bacterium]|nr:PAS domain-containing protein [Burkholderiales bacterium]
MRGQLDWRLLASGTSAVLVAMFAASFWAQGGAAAQMLPHGFCFTWLPGLVALHVLSDALIALAYFSIPLLLVYLVRKRGDLPFGGLFLLFSAFIVSCGLSHATGVWTIWYPDYWMSGMVKAMTAAVSISAAVVLARNLPLALAIPSSSQLQSAHDALAREVEIRRQVELELRSAQMLLEERVAERVRELNDANALVDALFRSAPVGLVVFDEELRYLRINPALAEINGVPAADHLGRRLSEIVPNVDASVSEALQRVFETRVPVSGLEVSGLTPASVAIRHWSVGVFPIDVPGRPLRVGLVCEEVTDKRRMETERLRLLAQSQHANRAKDQFLAMVSHELRTPLQATLSWAHLLKARVSAPPEALDAIERIERNVRLQAKIIGDLLDISRILSGKLRLEPQLVDPDQCVRRAADNVRSIAEHKGVAVDVVGRGVPTLLNVDPVRLEQVVWNLINNSVQFTDPGGGVTVTTGVDANAAARVWTLRVADTGAGIDSADLATLFEPFRQGKVGPSNGQRGLGLGLAITRNIVELSGGHVEAFSEGVGKGATFEVRLPLEVATTAGSGEGETGTTATAHALEGVRVLVVEDNADVADALAAGLEAVGARTAVCASVSAALAEMARSEVQVLVCDLNLGVGGTGFELLAAMSAQRPGQAPRAIALSAYGREEDFAATHEAGFDAHLVKPVDPDTVVLTIVRLLSDARSLDLNQG